MFFKIFGFFYFLESFFIFLGYGFFSLKIIGDKKCFFKYFKDFF